MKKVFALILALTMMVALAVPASAYDVAENKTAEIPVTGTYNLVPAGHVYAIDITWEGMTFVYTETNRWDPAQNDGKGGYVPEGQGSWSQDTITVTNKSNAGVVATLEFTEPLDGITGALSKETMNLGSAEVAPVSDTATLTISGGFTKAQNGATLGKVVVTLAAAV